MKRAAPVAAPLAALLATGLLAACSTPLPPPKPPQRSFQYVIPADPLNAVNPQPARAFNARFAIAAANPLATDAGFQVLKAGGSAVDAAIAVQMVLTLVEPQSSGIGGGAFVLHWDGRELSAWDGRETAPASADETLFLRADGKPMPFADAVVGGRSVGTPGAVRVLEVLHRRQGKLPWAELFAPAIALAEAGFLVSPRLHLQLKADPHLRKTPNARAFYYQAVPSGGVEPLPVGHLLKNPALAEVLRAVAARGSAALHGGPVAADIVARVRGHATNPGRLSEADLAGYAPKQREPICTDWKTIYRVCGMPPPSSGHIAIMQMLGVLERLPQTGLPHQGGVPSAGWLHQYTEAARLAFADRSQYIADPDFVSPPAGDWRSLLGPAYLTQRAALVGAQSMQVAKPGLPEVAKSEPVMATYAPMPEQPERGTSHVSIVDGDGRAIAMTTTIEAVWGSRLMSDGGSGKPGGFMLNNQLTDFSLAPADAEGRPIATRVQPGKRPRSSMSPTLVFDKRDGRLLISAGSPGGAAIIHFTAKTLVGTLAWGLSPQDAIDSPNFGSFNGPTLLERGRFPAATVDALKARGHLVEEVEMTSGLQAIQRVPGGWVGGADRRREGVVMGD